MMDGDCTNLPGQERRIGSPVSSFADAQDDKRVLDVQDDTGVLSILAIIWLTLLRFLNEYVGINVQQPRPYIRGIWHPFII